MPDLYIKRSGIIIAEGNDRLDFFNRMSTNEVKEIPDHEYRKTVFTTDKGRIVDLATLINTGDKTIMAVNTGFEEKVISHLDKYIIMDDVKLTKSDEENFTISIFGDDAIDALNSSLNTDLKKDLKVTEQDGAYIYCDDLKRGSVNILTSEKNVQSFIEKLSGIRRLTDEEYETYRIENGIPGENEMNDQINPMESGLTDQISFTKGCYIGQEVIARLDAQGKIPKQMVLVESEEAFNNGEKIFPAGVERECGFITSSVKRNGTYKGLGFIRSATLNYDEAYEIKHEDSAIKIKISKLI